MAQPHPRSVVEPIEPDLERDLDHVAEFAFRDVPPWFHDEESAAPSQARANLFQQAPQVARFMG